MGDTARVIAFPASRMGDREPWVTRDMVAMHLGVSVKTVDRWRRAGMPSQKRRGARRFRLSDVDRWFRESA